MSHARDVWPAGDGEMAALVRARDWGATPLGPAAAWDGGLKAAVELILGSPLGQVVLWGPELVQIYNAAYAAIMGVKHPDGLGQPTRTCWPEVWTFNAPIYRKVLGGAAHVARDQKLTIARHGAPEDTWWDLSYSPIRDGEGAVAGVLVTAIETTGRIGAEALLRGQERRQAFLLQLSDALRATTKAEDAESVATRLLATHMGLSHADYATIDSAGGVERCVVRRAYAAPDRPSTASRCAVEDLPGLIDALRSGAVAAVGDVARDPRLSPGERDGWAAKGVGAYVMAPLVRDGRLTAILAAYDPRPRVWSDAEVALLQEVGDRTWTAAERVRSEAALRESELRFRAFVTASSDVVYRMSADWSEMRELDGRGFLADTPEPDTTWLAAYIPPEEQAEVRAAIDRAIRTRSIFDLEHCVRRADGGVGWAHSRAVPILDAQGEVAEWLGAAGDVTARRDAVLALHASERRTQTLLEGVPQLVWRAVDGGDWTWASPQWTRYSGQAEPDSHGQGWLDPVHPEDRERVLRVWAAAKNRGEFDSEYRIRSAATDRYRWFQARATPVRDDAGRIVEWLGTSTDVDDLRRLQDRQRVLLHELQHRVRNTLAVVRAMAASTGRTSESVEEFAAHLEGRLSALARTQSVLMRAPASGVDLETMVRDELLAQAARETQITVEGPEVGLSPKAAEVLTLAVHELATNAVKFGALGLPEGRVRVCWTASGGHDAPHLRLVWEESGVRVAAVAPRREGFGTELIEMRVPYELQGRGLLEFRPGGVRCEIEFPLTPGESILQPKAPLDDVEEEDWA